MSPGAVRGLVTPAGVPPRRALVVLAVALAVRLAHWFVATPDYVPQSDALAYHEIATNLAEGDGFTHTFPQLEEHPTAFRSPAYPAVLGALYVVTGPSVGAGRLLNLAVGLLAVHLVVCLAARVAGPRAAVAAGLAAALFAPLAYNDVALLTEPLSGVLLLLAVAAALDERPALAGLLCGLLVLSRSSAQLVLLVVAAWLVAGSSWRTAGVFVAVALAVLVPWVARNEAQLGLLGLTSANGFNLTAIYSEEAQASGSFVDPVFDERFEDVRLLQFDEAAWNDALVRRGLEGIRSDPTYVAVVLRRNLLSFTEVRPANNESAERLDGRNLTVRAWTSWLVPWFLVAGCVGLWLVRRARGTDLLVAVAAYFTVVSVLSIAAPRLRAPVDLVVCIGVGALADHLLSAVERRRAAPPAGRRRHGLATLSARKGSRLRDM